MSNQNELPNVSIIVPCYNEENTIKLLLAAILKQDYPLSRIEIVIADALSTDATRERIYQFITETGFKKIKIVDNGARTIPAGVNCAAKNASGDILIRLDAHSEPNEVYVRTSVDLLEKDVAENVGGIWEILPGTKTCIAKSIAKAAAHPLGVGDAKYRVSTKAQYVDTVPFGAFYKAKFHDLGNFDETLLANEDYEFNARLRNSGGRVWMDPRIQSKYYARKDIKALAKQYWNYGFWKWRMLRRYPSTIRWRQAIPPLFVAGVCMLAVFSLFFPFARIILGVILGVYLLALSYIGVEKSISERDACFLLVPMAIMTMHFAWGSGFLFNLLKSIRDKKKI